MLRHKAMMQCARIEMGFTGIYDQDEAERIIEASDDYIDVTPTVIEDDTLSATEELKRKIAENTKKASEIEQPEPKAQIEAEVDPNTGEFIPDDVGMVEPKDAFKDGESAAPKGKVDQDFVDALEGKPSGNKNKK